MTVVDEIEKIVQTVLDELNIELVEMQFVKSKRMILRIFVWEQGGITINRCTQASRRIADALDSTEILNGRYFLEVSSPGLQRPLQTERDFQRAIGEKIKITTQAEEKNAKMIGKLVDVRSNQITIENDERITVNLDEIITAKIIVEIKPS